MAMKVLVSVNAFKGSISARAATDIVATAFVAAGFEVEKVYLADGGDGTVDVAVALGGHVEFVQTFDPIMRPIQAPVVWLGRTAVIEMARASGMALIAAEERNPMVTTTWGTGVLMRYAIEQGAERIILGVGGSATVDGGLGMLAAMGFTVVDEAGAASWRGGEGLSRLARIVASPPQAKRATLVVASDVTSPLIGPTGAAAVFGPQKGATPEMVTQLEKGLEHLADITFQMTGVRLQDMPGAGAAGGVAGAAVAWLGGHLEPGAELFMGLEDFDTRAVGCSVLVTGEGRIDAQTVAGKAPIRVARRFRKVSPKGLTIGITGEVRDRAQIREAGIDVFVTIEDRPMTEHEAMENGEVLLRQAAAEIAHLLSFSA
ncbi:MAG: glycerate kinase [Candidatus Cryosericum sp.]